VAFDGVRPAPAGHGPRMQPPRSVSAGHGTGRKPPLALRLVPVPVVRRPSLAVEWAVRSW
jgi:hypothetical protein